MLFEFGECAGVEADGVWLAGGECVPCAYLSFQDVFIAAEGEDGDLGFGLKVHDPVNRDSGPGVLADFADAVDLLAAAAGGDYLGDQEQVAGVVSADFPLMAVRATSRGTMKTSGLRTPAGVVMSFGPPAT